jgi:hypothetical protein
LGLEVSLPWPALPLQSKQLSPSSFYTQLSLDLFRDWLAQVEESKIEKILLLLYLWALRDDGFTVSPLESLSVFGQGKSGTGTGTLRIRL